MMTKEIEHKVINYERLDDKNPSGSRTALRLHRALKMVSLLLNKIAKNEHDGKMSTIAYESYHGSPMPAHHPWVSNFIQSVAENARQKKCKSLFRECFFSFKIENV